MTSDGFFAARFSGVSEARLSIIIVSFNTSVLLNQNIGALLRFGPKNNYEIIVVDNASTDGSAEMVEQGFPGVTLIKNPLNLGFAAANNQAMKTAGGRYLLLLNSDAFIEEQSVETLIRFMEDHPRAAAAGPKILNTDGTLQNKGFCFPSIKGSLLFLFGIDRLLGPKLRARLFPGLYWDEDQTTKVDFLHGCCMIVRKDALNVTGGLPEDYFMYFEEQDWCYRAWRGGLEIWYVPSARVVHWGSASPMDNRPEVFGRSMLLFFRKNIGTLRGLTITALQVMSASISFFCDVLRRQDRAKREKTYNYLTQQLDLLADLFTRGRHHKSGRAG
ncbi:MAG: glycosyltransferase family 2 protein [Nitrospirae bacterium]|nr:glycosyltransferase family 2 protein [Nitrospirota bacterium]